MSVLSPTLCNSPGCCKDLSTCSFCTGFQIPSTPLAEDTPCFLQGPFLCSQGTVDPKYTSEPRSFVLPAQILSIAPFRLLGFAFSGLFLSQFLAGERWQGLDVTLSFSPTPCVPHTAPGPRGAGPGLLHPRAALREP